MAPSSKLHCNLVHIKLNWTIPSTSWGNSISKNCNRSSLLRRHSSSLKKCTSYWNRKTYGYNPVEQDNVIARWWRQYDIISTPIPRSVIDHVSIERFSIGQQISKFSVSYELVEYRFGTDQLCHLAAVVSISTHDGGQRPKYVGTDHLYMNDIIEQYTVALSNNSVTLSTIFVSDLL